MAVYIGKDQPSGWVIKHYGVKGMKWGKRKARGTTIPEKYITEKREIHKSGGMDRDAMKKRLENDSISDVLNNTKRRVKNWASDRAYDVKNYVDEKTGQKERKRNEALDRALYDSRTREIARNKQRQLDDSAVRRYSRNLESVDKHGNLYDRRQLRRQRDRALNRDDGGHVYNEYRRSESEQKDFEDRIANVEHKHYAKKGKGARRKEKGGTRRTDR